MRKLILVMLSGPALAQPAPPSVQAVCSAQPLVMGCANAANLAAMLANPADLETPQTAPAPIGMPSLLPLERYRLGKPLPMPDAGADSGTPGTTPQ